MNLTSVEIGQSVAVRSTEGFWVRGEVLLNEGMNQIVVKMVDDCEIKTFSITSLFPLSPVLAMKTRKSVRAKLHGIKPSKCGDLWQTDIVVKFKHLLEEYKYVALADFIDVSHEKNCYEVKLSVFNGKIYMVAELERLNVTNDEE